MSGYSKCSRRSLLLPDFTSTGIVFHSKLNEFILPFYDEMETEHEEERLTAFEYGNRTVLCSMMKT